jgi:hypothetical protein
MAYYDHTVSTVPDTFRYTGLLTVMKGRPGDTSSAPERAGWLLRMAEALDSVDMTAEAALAREAAVTIVHAVIERVAGQYKGVA